MAEVAWRGGRPPPGGAKPYYNAKGRQLGWRFQIRGGASKNVPLGERSKIFYLSEHDEGAEAAAENYQREIAEVYGPI